MCQLHNDRACDAIPGHCYFADSRKSVEQGVEGSCMSFTRNVNVHLVLGFAAVLDWREHLHCTVCGRQPVIMQRTQTKQWLTKCINQAKVKQTEKQIQAFAPQNTYLPSSNCGFYSLIAVIEIPWLFFFFYKGLSTLEMCLKTVIIMTQQEPPAVFYNESDVSSGETQTIM